MNKQTSVCLINRNYPPIAGATGYHAFQLGQYLLSQDIDVHIVTTSNGDLQSNEENIHYVKPFYNGSRKNLRLLGSYIEASRLVAKAIKLNVQYYIVMTDPPLLNYIAARSMKGRKWILWTMDLFPDGFVANGLVSHTSRLLKAYQQQLVKNPPTLLITLGGKQKQHLLDKYFPETPSIQWPIGFRNSRAPEQIDYPKQNLPIWATSNKTVLAYVGNLGEAHNPDVLLWIAEALNPEEHVLVLSCRGAHQQKIENDLSRLEHVYVESRIPENLMCRIDVHIVSLRPEWTHICVPSKALSSLQYGGVVLFYGSKESDTWGYVSPVGWQASSKAEIKEWVQSIDSKEIELRKQKVLPLYMRLMAQQEKGWQDVTKYLKKQ